jgi:outer membrane receptor protein involved in Fe transport
MPSRFPTTSRLRAALIILALARGAASDAQVTNPPTAPSAAAAPAIELSPFEVRTDRDVGYLATHTLAGSRLNTSLRDTPVIIDVFTKEFLLDLGATSLDDAMLYANNSVVDDGGHSGAVNATSADQLGTFKFVSRGISGSKTRNYFETNLPINLYNTERLDDARGPNSVLFGIGSAGGTVNNSSKQARPGRRAAEFAVQAGSHQSLRSTVDVNVPLRKDVAAFRLNALREDKNSWRHHLGTDVTAWNPAVLVRPFRQTELRFDIERSRIGGTVSRNYPVNDQISRWLDAGSPVVASLNAATATAAETAQGLVRKFNTHRITWVEDQDFVFNAQNFRTSAPYVGSDADHSTIIRRPDLYPYESNASGPGTRKDQDLGSETFVIEQRLSRSFALELGYYHERLDSLKYDLDTTPEIYGDPDLWLRNPAQLVGLTGFAPARDSAGNLINPNAGRHFMQTIWQRYVDHLDSRSYRGTLAWEKDAGRFGAHRAALYGARQEEKTQNWSEREVWSGAGTFFSADPLNDNNGVMRRRYLTPGDAASQYLPDPLAKPTLALTYPGVASPISSTWAQKSGGTHSTRHVDSAMLALQSHWWQRRIVTTVGYRRDDLTQTRVDPVRDASGIWAGTQGVWAFNDAAYAAKRTFSFTGKTHTGGLVLHPHRAVSVFANGSRNLGLPAFTLRVGPDGVAPPPPRGEGFDAGVLVSFADDRLVARVSYFSTKRTDQTASMGVNGFVLTNYNSVLNTLRPYYTQALLAKYDLLRTEAVATGDSLDNENTGFEARLTANLGASLRFNLNYSQSVQERTNVYKRTEAMFAQLDAFIAEIQAANRGVNVAQLPTGIATSGLTTIGETLATTYFDLDGRKADFESAFGNRKHKANFFGTYAFKEGRLRGTSAGLGARYLSGAKIGRVITAPGSTIRTAGAGGTGPGDGSQESVYSQDSLEFDAMARYAFRPKLGRFSAAVSFQLNVRNLLDRQKIQITRYKSNGTTVDRFALYSPREITLSTRVSF